MPSVACMTALESGQTIAGLSDSIIQWVHWSTMLQLQLLWFHKVSNVQCSCRAWPWQTILRLVWLYHWPVTGQRDTSLCRGVSEPEVFLGCDEFCNYVRGPGKVLDSFGLQLHTMHSCLFKWMGPWWRPSWAVQEVEFCTGLSRNSRIWPSWVWQCLYDPSCSGHGLKV